MYLCKPKTILRKGYFLKYIYLKSRSIESERPSIYWFAPQMSTRVNVGPAEGQGMHLRLPRGWRGPQHLAITHWPPRCNSRKAEVEGLELKPTLPYGMRAARACGCSPPLHHGAHPSLLYPTLLLNFSSLLSSVLRDITLCVCFYYILFVISRYK